MESAPLRSARVMFLTHLPVSTLHDSGDTRLIQPRTGRGSGLKTDKGLFISFDRQDVGGWSHNLRYRLAERFGEEAVFRDAQDIEPGERWPAVLERQVRRCQALVLVIGPGWGPGGEVLQRLQDPENWVRREVRTAIENGRRIVPVLVGGAHAPRESDLPEGLGEAVRDIQHLALPDTRAWEPSFGDLLGHGLLHAE